MAIGVAEARVKFLSELLELRGLRARLLFACETLRAKSPRTADETRQIPKLLATIAKLDANIARAEAFRREMFRRG